MIIKKLKITKGGFLLEEEEEEEDWEQDQRGSGGFAGEVFCFLWSGLEAGGGPGALRGGRTFWLCGALRHQRSALIPEEEEEEEERQVDLYTAHRERERGWSPLLRPGQSAASIHVPAGLSLRRVADLRVSAVRVYLSSDTFWVCVPENRFHPPLLSGSPTSAGLFLFSGD